MRTLFDPQKLLIIAGPCALESRELAFEVAHYLLEIQKVCPEVEIIFKTSCDKANRSSVHSQRGIGFDQGLPILCELKEATGLPIICDVHLPEHTMRVAEVCDVLQIPAFLCRQTDLLRVAAETGRVIAVKKGQFLSPEEMRFVFEKLKIFGATEIWPMERGATFGYHNLVVDMRSFPIMRQFSPVAIFDATHSVQIPGTSAGVTMGHREFVENLAYAALSAGANGLFFEVHTDPDHAICDAANQLDVHNFLDVIRNCVRFWLLRRTIENA
ncbi:MAG: 3-deoxy-8-phosphooctulonate synthase [Verrucomicrobiota bacterium]|nr:MAG: 3-deoxy-8-phosphooctulonate synthase [Verrucomicrobiota bacterium]